MKEIEKIKSLPKEKRLQYIWDYYWVHILAVIGIIVVGGIMIKSSMDYQEPVIDVIMINTYKTGDEQEQVLGEFLEQNGYRADGASVDVNIRFGIDESNDAYSTNQLMCATAAGEGDLYFWNGKEFDPYIGRGALADLREYLSQEFLEEVKEKLTYAEIDGDKFPCGVNLADNQWAEEHGYLTGGYVGIGRNVQNVEVSVLLLQEILTQYH